MDQFAGQSNPFPGIRSYEISESHLFFGRDTQVGELIERLFQTHFLAIVGSSGCGKSSLIKAGLIPSVLKIHDKHKHGKWSLSFLRPGDDPICNLANALTKANNPLQKNNIPNTADQKEAEKFLRAGPDGIIKFLSEKKSDYSNNLIVIDQFEELFRFRKSSSGFGNVTDAALFVGLLLYAINRKDVSTYIVLSMRTDFLDDCNEFHGLTQAINQGYYLVPRLQKNEIEEAITKPIKIYGGNITKELVARLLNDVGSDPDQLPVLQHSLMRTWNYWRLNKVGEQPIDILHYEAIGTMHEALSFHLEEIYSALRDPKHKFIAEKLFKALTDFEQDKRGIRRPTRLSEICVLCDSKPEEVVEVIDKFREQGCAFLMPPYNISLNEDSIIDISHESIMRVWSRLKIWIDEENESAQLYLRLTKSAELYQEGKSGLWVNPELQLALRWREQNKPNATWAMRYNPAFDRAINFLEYSNKEYEREIARRENQQKRNLRRAKNFAVILGAAALISILLMVISLNLRFKAETSKKEALEKEKIAQFESKRAEKEYKEAILQKKISEQQQQIAEQQKIITEEQKQFAVEQQLIAEEQTRKAVSEKHKADIATDEAIIARDEADQQRIEAINHKKIAEAERVKAEKSEQNIRRLRLLSISRSLAHRSLRLQKTMTDELPALLALTAYKFNLDNDGAEINSDLFNALSVISGDEIIIRTHTDGVRALDISGDDKLLASCGDDGNVFIWNLQNPNKPVKLNTGNFEQYNFRTVTFSPDGNQLAAGTSDGKILIWNIKNPRTTPEVFDLHIGRINQTAFSHDGKILASAGSNGRLSLLIKNDGNYQTEIVDSVNSAINVLCFDNTNNFLYWGTDDGRILVTSLQETTFSTNRFFRSDIPVTALSVCPECGLAAAGYKNGSVRIFDLKSGKEEYTEWAGHHTSTVSSIVFNPIKSLIVTASLDGSIKIEDFRDHSRNILINRHELWVHDLVVTNDGQKLISAGADRSIRIYTINLSLLFDKLLGQTGRNMTIEEWEKYVGEEIEFEPFK